MWYQYVRDPARKSTRFSRILSEEITICTGNLQVLNEYSRELTNPNSEIMQVTGYGLAFLHVSASDSLSLHSPPQKTLCILGLLKFTRFLSPTFLFP